MTPDPAQIRAAPQTLAELGVTLADLQDDPAETPGIPTLAGYLPHVIAAAGAGASRTYGNYWTRMATAWGDRRLDQITATDIEAMQHDAATHARTRRNTRNGRHASEHVVAAARAIFNRAIADDPSPPRQAPLTASPNPAGRRCLAGQVRHGQDRHVRRACPPRGHGGHSVCPRAEPERRKDQAFVWPKFLRRPRISIAFTGHRPAGRGVRRPRSRAGTRRRRRSSRRWT